MKFKWSGSWRCEYCGALIMSNDVYTPCKCGMYGSDDD